MSREDQDPIEVQKITEPGEVINSLSQSLCSCKLDNDILLFGKKGMLTAIRIANNKIVPLHQCPMSGSIEQLWYSSQYHLLLALIDKKLIPFTVDLTKKATNEVFKKISTNTKCNSSLEGFAVLSDKVKLWISVIQTKRGKSTLFLIEAQKTGIFIKETKVHAVNETIYGVHYIRQKLIVVYQNRIQLLSIFKQLPPIEKNTTQCKSKPRFMQLQKQEQILVHTGQCVYIIDDESINIVPNDYPVVAICSMLPFVFFMLEFSANKFYVTYRLEPMTYKSPSSIEFKRPEYNKSSFMHEAAPIFVNGAYKQLTYFTPNPKWYESAIRNGHYQSAIEFITTLGNGDENTHLFEKSAYTLDVISQVTEFYENEKSRTSQNIISFINKFKMGEVTPKNVITFFVMFIFKDFFIDLYKLFEEWYLTSPDEWKSEMVHSFPETLSKNLQESITKLIEARDNFIKNRKKGEVFDSVSKNKIIDQFISYLFAFKTRLTVSSIKEEDVKIFYTSFFIIAYYYQKLNSNDDKIMNDLMKDSNHFKETVIIETLNEPTEQNIHLLMEFYINKKYIEGVFSIDGIDISKKKLAVIRILSNSEKNESSSLKAIDKIQELIQEEFNSSDGVPFNDETNEKIEDEIDYLFGRDKCKYSCQEVISIIQSWELEKSNLTEEEKNELKSRFGMLYLLQNVKRTKDAATIQLFVAKLLSYFELIKSTPILVSNEFINEIVELLEKYPEIVNNIEYSNVSGKYYKLKALIGMTKNMKVYDVLLTCLKEVKNEKLLIESMNGENESVEQLVDFIKQSGGDISMKTYKDVIFSSEVEAVIKKEYQPLKSVNNLFVEMVLVILQEEDKKKIIAKLLTEADNSIPGDFIKFLWDLLNPLTFAFTEDMAKNEIKSYEKDEDLKMVLEGILSFMISNDKVNQSILFIDCCFKYLNLPGLDRLNVTKQLMERKKNNPNLQNRFKDEINSFHWRIRCQIKYQENKVLGVLEYYKQLKESIKEMKQEQFEDDFFTCTKEFFREIDFITIDEMIESKKDIRDILRQIERNIEIMNDMKPKPFSDSQPSNVLLEILFFCICEVNDRKYSPLLSLLLDCMLDDEEKVVPKNLILFTFTNFFPIIPLKFNEKFIDKYKLYEFPIMLNLSETIFSKVYDTIDSYDDLALLSPSIHFYSNSYIYNSFYLSSNVLFNNSKNHFFEIVRGDQVCCSCSKKILKGEKFAVCCDKFYCQNCLNKI